MEPFKIITNLFSVALLSPLIGGRNMQIIIEINEKQERHFAVGGVGWTFGDRWYEGPDNSLMCNYQDESGFLCLYIMKDGSVRKQLYSPVNNGWIDVLEHKEMYDIGLGVE